MKKSLVFASVVFTLLVNSLALAEGVKFEQSKFEAELKTGMPILVAVHAPWCSTCIAQAPAIKEALLQKEFQKISLILVDYDSQKDALKKLNVNKQSTLIVFKNGKEVGRSLGVTTTSGVESLLEKAI